MEDNAHHRPQAQVPGDASTREDATLDELAALETEVDNWLRPAAKPAAAPLAVEPSRIEAVPPQADVAPARIGLEPTQAEAKPPRIDAEPPPTEVEPPRTAIQIVSFEPNLRELTPPRRPRRTLSWALGLGAIAAALGAAMFVSQQEQTGSTLRVAATGIREPAPAPVVNGPAMPEWKPVEMVFLKQAPAAGATAPTPPVATAEPQFETVDPTVESAEPPTATGADEPPAAEPSDAAVDTPPPAAAVPIKPKKTAVLNKANTTEKKATLAKRTPTAQTGRRLSDSERVNAAIAQCHKTARDPSACNIRVCDVLGSSHPACRE